MYSMGARWEEMGSMWLQMALGRFLEKRPYYPCCLLVSRDVAVLARAVVEAKRLFAWPVVSTDDVACEPLLSLPVTARAGQVNGLIDTAVLDLEPS